MVQISWAQKENKKKFEKKTKTEKNNIEMDFHVVDVGH